MTGSRPVLTPDGDELRAALSREREAREHLEGALTEANHWCDDYSEAMGRVRELEAAWRALWKRAMGEHATTYTRDPSLAFQRLQADVQSSLREVLLGGLPERREP